MRVKPMESQPMKEENQPDSVYPKLDTQTAKSFMIPLLSCSSKDEIEEIKTDISKSFGRPGLAKILTMLSEEQIERLSGLPQSIPAQTPDVVEPINTEHPTDEALLAYIAEPIDVVGVRKRKHEVIEKWGLDTLVRISRMPIKSTLYGRIDPFPYFSPKERQELGVDTGVPAIESGHWRSLNTGELRVGLQLKVDKIRSGHHGKIGEYTGGRDDMYDRGRKRNLERYGVIIGGREWFFEKNSLLIYDPNPQPIENMLRTPVFQAGDES